MASTKMIDIRRGMVLNMNGALWYCLDRDLNTPGNWRAILYLKLKNLTIGYTLPLKTSGNFAPKIRFYVTGQNLFNITKYTGADPEIGQPVGTDVNNPSNTSYRSPTASGVDVGTYPNSRYYIVGFNVTF